ncbi:hypothetical protein GCM10028787_30950 [Brachybacterium horti]
MSTQIPIGSIVRLHSELGDDGLMCIVIGEKPASESPVYRLGVVKPRRFRRGARIRPLRDRLVDPSALEVLHPRPSPSSLEEGGDTSDSAESQALEAQKKQWEKADHYLKGLDLPGVRGDAEKRAALHAWKKHDLLTGIPMVTALVGGIATLASGKLTVAVVTVLGIVLIAAIHWDDGRRVMAEAVLEVRDSPRRSLKGEGVGVESSTSTKSGAGGGATTRTPPAAPGGNPETFAGDGDTLA